MARLHPITAALATLIRHHRLTYQSFNEHCKLARRACALTQSHSRRRLPQLLPADALRRFYATIDAAGNIQHQIMLRLLFYTAIRVGELVAIEITQVNLAQRQIFISQGKGDKDRVVLFPDAFGLVLQVHIKANPDAKYLFESRQNRPFSARRVQQLVQEYAAMAQLPFHVHPHLLRHQMLTHLTASGLTDAQIQLVSGHSSKASLEIYQHLSVQHTAGDYQKAMKGVEI